MFDTAFVLLVIAALLVVIGVCQPLAARLKLPPPALLGGVGGAFGGFPPILSQLGWSAGSDPLADIFAELPVSSETFIYVFLPLLVFEAGIVTDVRRTLEDAAPLLLLAIVAATDPAAVIAIFRDVGAPARLMRLVEGEALLNDAAAISQFGVLLGMIASRREPDIGSGLSEFFLSFIGGGVFGVFSGRGFALGH